MDDKKKIVIGGSGDPSMVQAETAGFPSFCFSNAELQMELGLRAKSLQASEDGGVSEFAAAVVAVADNPAAAQTWPPRRLAALGVRAQQAYKSAGN